ncbi:glutathione S-transferase omega-1-like isoform X1 [Corythoichthys intestinalis]|uniref:glutathione S-transferase omega-1-like isoform X1 n=1 Tax=Corythoichthys intestinalis TaxID=161448 RepID=UPI0025A58617|nr:glutathione S-transferase omega-1-like isoform X1 [Corythoichthys intestinalis]XP_061794157.1 glutathione S-transferase omega-1-like [Nerophis lumbriciformis]
MTSGKCVSKGCAAPGPVPAGSIRLYSMRFCPFAQRARLVLNAKGIKHDIVNINLRDKPDWFLEKNPLGQVPTLETSAGEVIYESPITCDYLDEVYPEKKLLPETPLGKAQHRMMLENFSKIAPLTYKIPLGRLKGEDVSGLHAELKQKFCILNKELAQKKTKFFGGDCVGMTDYMAWPWFERLEAFELEDCLDGSPELKAWVERMFKDPVVKASGHSVETYKDYYKTYLEGKPNFDYGL